MGWVVYALAWLAAALFWALAAASGAGRSPFEALPFALLAMGSAALLGVGVHWLTGRVAWDGRSASFYVVHASALAVFALVYATSWMWPDVVTGRIAEALAQLRSSPVVTWNLLMGTWLYLVVAGISYAMRGERRVRAEEKAAAEAHLLAERAQLAALRAQVNPHFLFNALHSVGALVESDPPRADEALERLGELLRYALGSEEEVPFADEWKFTENYLAFERLRLGDRLKVDARAEPASLEALVPPLILQPLVENAVRHGISDRLEGGRVELGARVEGDDLVLRVRDDGAGGGAAASRDGLGLASVRRRLELRYGGRAALSVDSGAGGYDVSVRIPIVEDPPS
jgi:signal transduction histidine kinase